MHRTFVVLVSAAVLISAAVLLLVVSVLRRTPARTGRTSASLSPYDRAVLSDHPVGFWDMSARGVSEPDRSGNGHDGRYRGGRPAHALLPDREPAAGFDGTSEYLSVPSAPSFSIAHTGALTWEAWIRPDTLQFSRPVNADGYVDWMGKCQDYAHACEWEARLYSARTPQGRCDRVSAYAFNLTGGRGSGADWQPACGMLSAGRWYYVVGEYQTRFTPAPCQLAYPGTIMIWVDGVRQDFAQHAPTGCMSQYRVRPRSAGSPLNIGSMALDAFFPGAVGKLAIYDAVLTQQQIDAHYRTMTGASPSGHCADACTLSG